MTKIKNNELSHTGNAGTSNIVLGSAGQVTIAGDLSPSKLKFGSDAAGDIAYYNGTGYTRLAPAGASRTLKMNSSNNAPEWVTVTSPAITPTAMTAWTTCGTSSTLNLTGLSADAERFQLFLHELSFGSGVNPAVRLGTGGSAATSGYCAHGWRAATSQSGDDDSDKIEADGLADAAYKTSWQMDFVHCGSNKWYMQGVGLCDAGSGAATTGTFGMAGKITLGGTLDIIQILGGTIDGGTYRLITWT